MAHHYRINTRTSRYHEALNDMVDSAVLTLTDINAIDADAAYSLHMALAAAIDREHPCPSEVSRICQRIEDTLKDLTEN